jgi:hypothetical protein
MSLVRRFELSGVQCVDVSGGSARYPQIDQATIRFDATWAPYIQATLSGPPPSDSDLTAIDPRDGWAIRFDVKEYDETGAQLGSTLHCELGIRTRDRTFADQPRMTITAASAEARLQDFADGIAYDPSGHASPATIFAGTTVTAAGLSMTVVAGAPDATVQGEDAVYDAGMSYWTYVSGLAEAAGGRIWVDETNTMRWSSPTWVADTSMHYLTAGIIEVTDTVSRDDPAWANFAVVTYTKNDPVESVSDGVSDATRKAVIVPAGTPQARRQRRDEDPRQRAEARQDPHRARRSPTSRCARISPGPSPTRDRRGRRSCSPSSSTCSPGP